MGEQFVRVCGVDLWDSCSVFVVEVWDLVKEDKYILHGVKGRYDAVLLRILRTLLRSLLQTS